MGRLQWLKNILHPYSRVPPSVFSRFLPRILGKLGNAEKDVNEAFPGVHHRHIELHDARPFELGQGNRVEQKWNPKPWEKAYTTRNDVPISKEEAAENPETRGVGLDWKPAGGPPTWLPSDKFPLHDYTFPRHPGRLLLHWLYKRGVEPCNMQRAEMTWNDFGSTTWSTFGWRAPTAILIGKVKFHPWAAVYDGCVLRADVQPIVLLDMVHIMENCTLTSAPGLPDRPRLGQVYIDRHSTVGPNCTLTGCWIGRECVIGSGSTIGYGARIGDRAIVGAGSVVEEDQYIPSDEVWVGRPARYLRKAGDVDAATSVLEAYQTTDLHLEYEHLETTQGNVWAQQEKLCDELEVSLEARLGTPSLLHTMVSKDFDPALLQLPPSLVQDLMEIVPDEEHPNPKPTLSAQYRTLFKTRFDFNRSAMQRPVWTGNYSNPDTRAMD